MSHARVPKLRKHAKPGRAPQAYATFRGKRYYFGPWGAPETDTAYRQFAAEWLASGGPAYNAPQVLLSVLELGVQFLRHMRVYYANSPETFAIVCASLKAVTDLYGDTPAVQFTPKCLKTVRDVLVRDGLTPKRKTHQRRGLCRKEVNRRIQNIKRCFRWGASEELIPASVAHALDMVEGLRAGHTAATEHPPVKPATWEAVQAVLPHLNDSTKALVLTQWWTGARSGELVTLKKQDIDRSGAIWVARLTHHKTARFGRERAIFFGPEAQAVLRAVLLRRRDGDYLFKPEDAVLRVIEASTVHRRPSQRPNPRKTDRGIGDHYSTGAYANALRRACQAANCEKFTPHQLRHAAATRIRAELGLEAAAAVLGHAGLRVTEIYAAVSEQRALDAMAKLG